MLKRKLSAILAGASKDELAVIANQIKSANNIKILKEPQKTLVMVKVRESVKNRYSILARYWQQNVW